MLRRLEAKTPTFVRRHYLLLWFLAGLVLVTAVLFAGGRMDPEAQAFRQVCHDLAAQVVEDAATGFDYMATRCPAQMLTEAQTATGDAP